MRKMLGLLTGSIVLYAIGAYAGELRKNECFASKHPKSPFYQCEPVRISLDAYLTTAQADWNHYTTVRSIAWSDDLGDCKSTTERSGWSDIVERRIYLNSNCQWTPDLARAVVLHEYGHMLMGQAHSLDPASIMFWQVNVRQRITRADRERLTEALMRAVPE